MGWGTAVTDKPPHKSSTMKLSYIDQFADGPD